MLSSIPKPHLSFTLMGNSPQIRMERNQNQIVVMASRKNFELLSIPKKTKSSVQQIAGAVLKMLNNWLQVQNQYLWLNHVFLVCWSLIWQNNGKYQNSLGDCAFIENRLNCHIFFLAYKHHMMEFIITSVFGLFFKSSSPKIAQFTRFKSQWESFNQKYTSHSTMMDQAISFWNRWHLKQRVDYQLHWRTSWSLTPKRWLSRIQMLALVLLMVWKKISGTIMQRIKNWNPKVLHCLVGKIDITIRWSDLRNLGHKKNWKPFSIASSCQFQNHSKILKDVQQHWNLWMTKQHWQ